MRLFLSTLMIVSFSALLAQAGNTELMSDMPRGTQTFAQLATIRDTVKSTMHQGDSRPKSGIKAALLSAALPGLGQLYLDEKGKGQFYLIAEGATWATFAAFQIYSKWKEDDFERLAITEAGVDVASRNDEYIDLVAFYNNVDEYNALGRITESDRSYIDPNDSTNAWYWSDPAQRNTFRQLKNSSREASRRSQFAVGLAIVNRAASVIDALLSARRSIKEEIDNKFSFLEDMNMRFSVHPSKPERILRLTWYPEL